MSSGIRQETRAALLFCWARIKKTIKLNCALCGGKAKAARGLRVQRAGRPDMIGWREVDYFSQSCTLSLGTMRSSNT